MRRDHDESESPPPKRSRKSEPTPQKADKADRADTASEPPQRKTDDEKQPYWEVGVPRGPLQPKYVG
jgi:hypothetical protein